MKKTILTIVCCAGASLASAQTLKGKIVSAETKQPISSATVKLLLSKTATGTNNNGEFTLTKNAKIDVDTLMVTSLGYLTFKTATNKAPANGIIILKEDPKNLREVGINKAKKKTATLHPFLYENVLYSIAKDTAKAYVSSKFPIAKLFTATVDSFKLQSIHIGRFVERINEPLTYLIRSQTGTKIVQGSSQLFFYNLKKHTAKSIFNIYIIYPDVNNQPGPLNTAIKIPVSLQTAETDTEINLDEYNIWPKQRNFYVAIEWLPILPNQNYSLGKRGHPRIFREFTLPTPKNLKNDGSPEMALAYELGYEPYVAMYGIRTTEAAKKYAWIKNQWVPIEGDPTQKFDQEIALSADISYY